MGDAWKSGGLIVGAERDNEMNHVFLLGAGFTRAVMGSKALLTDEIMPKLNLSSFPEIITETVFWFDVKDKNKAADFTMNIPAEKWVPNW